jgi:outer membrane receptor protein involved in Fe transport
MKHSTKPVLLATLCSEMDLIALKKIFLLFCLSLMLSFTQLKAQTGSIQGYVSNNNLPVAYAQIQVEALSILAISDSLGYFTIKSIPAGLHQLKFTCLGYKPMFKSISVKQNLKQTVRVNLVQDIIDLKMVEVLPKSESAPNMIRKLDLQLRPLSSSQDLLRLVPGLFIAQHAGGGKAEQIFLRGFDIDHGTDFAIYVDGIPVNMPSHAHGQGYADLHFLIPETVAELAVIKGPHSTKYGDLATAGSGEFSTLNALNTSSVKLEYGAFNTKRALAMVNLLNSKHLFSKKKENWYIAGEYRYTNSYFEQSQNFNRYNIFTKYTGELNNGAKLSISLSSFQSSWDASGQIPVRKVNDGSITRFGSIDPTEGGETGRSNFNIIYEKNRGNKQFKQQLFYSRYDFNLYSNFTFFLNDSIRGDQIFQADHRNIFGYNSSVKVTNKLFNKKFVSNLGTGVRYDNASIQLDHTQKQVFLNQMVGGKLNQVNAWAFAETNVSLSSKLRLNAGTRFDAYSFNFKNTKYDTASGNAFKYLASPKINLDYFYSNTVQFFAKSGFGFHSNDARAVIIGNLENTLARAFGNELGVMLKPTKRVLVNMALWGLDLQSELVYVGDEGIVEAAGRTRRVGVDFGVRFQMFKYWCIDADINLNKGWLRDEPSNANRIPLAPNFTSIGGISYKNPKQLNGSLRYRYMANRAAVEDNSITAQGFFLVDAVVNYNIKSLQFGITLENLLNSAWKEAQFATESRLQTENASVNEIHFTPGTPRFGKVSVTYMF